MTQVAKRSFADIVIGETFTIERIFTVDDVQRFAHLSGDFSPLHVSPDYAATTEFRNCVVHGMLLASLFSQLVGMQIPGKHALYLGQDLTFRKPVLVGEMVTAQAKVIGKTEATYTILLATEIKNAAGMVVVSGSAKVKLRDQAGVQYISPTAASIAPAVGQQIALVTGASRGIGADVARRLATCGFAVAVNYFRSGDQARRVIQDIVEGGGVGLPIQADVRDPQDIAKMVDIVTTKLGRIGVLVNCATGELDHQPFHEMSWNTFETQLDYQLKATAYTCQAVYPMMKTDGGGVIVNILSQVIHGQPPSGMAAYVAAKHALWGLSKALAVEWAGDFIRVNTVSPGLTQTDLTSHYHDRVFKLEAHRTPLGRLTQPRDTANAVAFLCSQDAAFLTGINVFVTGGQIMT